MIGPYTFRSSAKVPIHDETKNKVRLTEELLSSSAIPIPVSMPWNT